MVYAFPFDQNSHSESSAYVPSCPPCRPLNRACGVLVTTRVRARAHHTLPEPVSLSSKVHCEMKEVSRGGRRGERRRGHFVLRIQKTKMVTVRDPGRVGVNVSATELTMARVVTPVDVLLRKNAKKQQQPSTFKEGRGAMCL